MQVQRNRHATRLFVFSTQRTAATKHCFILKLSRKSACKVLVCDWRLKCRLIWGVDGVNGFNYYLECYRHDVPASLHIYPSGGHGWGIRDSFKYHLEMELELRAWLRSF